MVEYFKMRPLLLSAVILSLITVIGFCSRVLLFVFGVIFIIALAFLIFKRVEIKYIITVGLAFAVTVSMLLTYTEIDRTESLNGLTVSGEFIVTEKPREYDGFYSLKLEVNGCEDLKDGTSIYSFSDSGDFKLGERISATISLKKIEDKYKASDYSDKIYLTGSIKKYEKVGERDFILSSVDKVRNYISDTLFSNMDYDEAATLTAIVFGDTSYFRSEFYERSKLAGVTHIMVVSGMHLAIIVAFITGICERYFYNRYFKAFIIFLTVLFVAMLCGFTKSILRAGICYLIYAGAVILKRDNISENALGGAVSIMLILEPFAVFSVSFQLSVLSTLGIVAVAVPINKFLSSRGVLGNRALKGVFEAANVSVCALLFTLPITSYIFGYTSTVSVVTNLLISFPVTLALIITAIGLLLYAIIPFLGYPFLFIAEIITKYINLIIEEFGSLPFAKLDIGKLGTAISVIILCAVIFGLFACKKRLDMLKLKLMNRKIIKEGGGKIKWQ